MPSRSSSLQEWIWVQQGRAEAAALLEACSILQNRLSETCSLRIGRAEDLLVAKEHFHSLIDRHLLLVGQRHQSIQIVNLTLNQAIHCPENGVQVWNPHPAMTC